MTGPAKPRRWQAPADRSGPLRPGRSCPGGPGLLAHVAADGAVALHDLRRGRPAGRFAPGFPVSCVAAGDGGVLVAGAADGAAVAVRPGGGPPTVLRAPAAAGPVRAVAAPGPGVLALCGAGTVLWWAGDGPPRTLDAPVPLDAVGWTPAGHVVGLGPAGAVAWDGRAPGRAVPLVLPPDGPHWPLVTATGRWAAVGGARSESRDLAGDGLLSGRPPVRMLGAGLARAGVLDTGGDRIVVVVPGGVRVLPFTPGDTPALGGYVSGLGADSVVGVVIHPDGLVALAHDDGWLTVLDLAEARLQWGPPAPRRPAGPPPR